MSVNFKSLSESISSRYSELKACGANKPGGGGFSTGNTCARGGGGGSLKEQQEREAKLAGGFADKASEKAKKDKTFDGHYAAMHAHNDASRLFEDIGDAAKVKHHNSASLWHESQALTINLRQAKRG